MTTDTAPPQEPAGERQRLLTAVRARLEGAGGPQGTAALHTEEARAETDALLRYLVGVRPDGTHGIDEEVAYSLGMALLVRADDRREAPASAADARTGVLLIAPFHFHPPGAPDVLPAPLRTAFEELLGPEGRRPGEPGAMVRRHVTAVADVAALLLELGHTRDWPQAVRAAADVTREVMPHLAPESTDRALAGCNLGYALLLARVRGEAGPEQLPEAVDVLRTAFARTPPDHANHARCANGLGLALLALASAREDRTPLPEAIDLLRRATRGAGPADANLAQMYADLGHALTVYAVSAGEGEEVDPGVRDEAVGALRQSLALTPEEEPEALRDRLSRLAGALTAGSPGTDRTHTVVQAAEAVEVLRRLLDLTPVDHPERGDVLLRLAAGLIAARRPQEVTDLLAGAGPVSAGDAGRTGQAEALLFQAAVLRGAPASRADLSPGLRDDSDAVDEILRPVLTGEGGDHPIAAVMGLLGMGPQGGGSRSQELMDFGRLVLGYPHQASLGDVLAKALELRARRISRLPEEERAEALAGLVRGGADEPRPVPRAPVDTSGLDELVEVHERVLSRMPADSPERRFLKSGRSTLVLMKTVYASTDETEDRVTRLDRMRETLPLLRELYEELPRQMRDMGIDPELFAGHTALAYAFESPFEHVRAVEDGVRGARRRLAGLEPGSREYDDTRAMLAMTLFIRHRMWGEAADFTEAEALARELTAVPEPDGLTARLLSLWTSAVRSRVQDAQLLGGARPRAGQSPTLVTRLASDGAARALDSRDPVEALETLEDGRAHLLSTALNTRRELAVLHGADAALHARLRDTLERLRALRRSMEPGRRPAEEEIGAQRAVAGEAARLITELQRRPGFQRFLTPLPLGLDDLRPAAAEGPVVSVNIHPRRCDALALGSDGLRAVRLPRLHASDLVAQAEAFRLAVETLAAGPHDPLFEEARGIFTATLAWLWEVLAEPVLEDLGFTGPPGPGAPWPRLWWSPSGVLNSFPLHAAGHHGPDAPAGSAVLDRVASSYTPTLRALLFARARRRAAPGRRGVVAVAMPETAGQAPLARTVAEATAAVATGGGTPLIGPVATREAVRAALRDAAVVHFACHAGSDPEDAAAGRLLLADGDLLIGDIAELRLEAAELAYLSACGTARGSSAPALVDEVIHLASVFQLAGYTQSVATLWEVGDAFAADAAAAFHRTLGPALPDPGPLPAALALHESVRALRAADPARPWTWSALVHAGA